MTRAGESLRRPLFKQWIEELRAACTGCHAAGKHAFIKIGPPTVRRNSVEKP